MSEFFTEEEDFHRRGEDEKDVGEFPLNPTSSPLLSFL
jgi:hypothetical protein